MVIQSPAEKNSSDCNSICRSTGTGTGMLAASICTAVLFFCADQLTKFLVMENIPLYSRRMIIPGFFNLTYLRNPGAAWGIFAGRQWLLLAVSLTAFTAVCLFFRKLAQGYVERIWGLMLVLSGIAGNCVDRIFRGEVVDFLEFHLGRFYWPAFNVADSCICVGIFAFIISSLFRPEQANK